MIHVYARLGGMGPGCKSHMMFKLGFVLVLWWTLPAMITSVISMPCRILDVPFIPTCCKSPNYLVSHLVCPQHHFTKAQINSFCTPSPACLVLIEHSQHRFTAEPYHCSVAPSICQQPDTLGDPEFLLNLSLRQKYSSDRTQALRLKAIGQVIAYRKNSFILKVPSVGEAWNPHVDISFTKLWTRSKM
jgi:hypothetical protein